MRKTRSVPGRKFATLPVNLRAKKRDFWKGKYSPGHEVDFVVAADLVAVGAEDHGGDVVAATACSGPEVGADAADDQRRMSPPRDGDMALLKRGSPFEKRGRGFRPDHQIGMGRIRRADDLAGGRTGLRECRRCRSCTARRRGCVELGHVLVPFAGCRSIAVVFHVEIGLDEDGAGGGKRRGGLVKMPLHAQKGARPQEQSPF